MKRQSIDIILKSNLGFYPFNTIRKALIYFSDLRAATISTMCLASLPYVSAKPGVSMRKTFFSDPLQNSSFLVVSNVSDYLLELTLNSFYFPLTVLTKELFPEPVDPITTTFVYFIAVFSSSYGWIEVGGILSF